MTFRKVLHLSVGAVVLQAWSARTADAYFADLLRLARLLDDWLDDWNITALSDINAADVEEGFWRLFWRLYQASLVTEPPSAPLSFADVLAVLAALAELNRFEEVQSKMRALRGTLNNSTLSAFR